MTTVTFGVTLSLYGISSSFANFIVDANAKTAVRNAILTFLPYFRREQSTWFVLDFNNYKLLNRRLRLLRADSPGEREREREREHVTGSGAINVQMSMTLRVISEFYNSNPVVVYDTVTKALTSATNDGSLSTAIRAEGAALGSTVLASVTTPIATAYTAFSSHLIKSPPPTQGPSSVPSSSPSRVPPKAYVTDNRLAVGLGATFGIVLVAAVLLFLYLCACKEPVDRFLERRFPQCCKPQKIEVAPEPEAWQKRAAQHPLGGGGGGGGSSGSGRSVLGFGSRPRVAPVLPAFSGDDCEDFEPVVPFRPTFDYGSGRGSGDGDAHASAFAEPRALLSLDPVDLGIVAATPPLPGEGSPQALTSLAVTARSLAIQAKVLRNLQLKERLDLQRRLPVGGPGLTSTAGAYASSPDVVLRSRAAANMVDSSNT